MTKRVVIFAGHNRKSKIENYVLYYLKGLREIADILIYAADNEPSPIYLQQLEKIVDKAVFEKHGEYDFGSWKRGLRVASQLSLLADADELVLCNDSCYGPVFPFAEMFAYMENSRGDFWGVTKNCQSALEHLQSYFMVFKKNVFNLALFKDFFEGVTQEKSFWDVVSRYEVGLSRLLIEKGKYSFDVYCTINSGISNPCKYGCQLLAARSPLIKRKIFSRGGFSQNSVTRLLSNISNDEIKKFMRDDYFAFFFKRIKYSILRFFYQNKMTKSGHRIIKICKIPLFCITTSYDL